jgi:trehalose/maltose transport system permease protein
MGELKSSPMSCYISLVTTRKALSQFTFYLLIFVIAVYILFPFYWAVVTALKTEREAISVPASWFPRQPTLENFRTVFRDRELMRSLVNSFIVAGSTTWVSLLIGSFAAFALGKLRFRFRRATLYTVLAMTTFPAISLLSGLFSLNLALRELDAELSWLTIPTQAILVAIYMIFALPFTIWTLSYFFKGLPNSLMQAARVDGATPLQILWHVLMPLSVPALVSAGLITFITTWNEYLFALTFTLQEPGARTVPVAITSYYDLGVPVGQVMAAALVVMVPSIILVTLFQHRIAEGLTAGSVKG